MYLTQPLHKVSVRFTLKTENIAFIDNKEGAKIAHDAIKFHYGGSEKYPKPMYLQHKNFEKNGF